MVVTSILSEPVSRIERNWKEVKIQGHSMQSMCSRICSFPISMPNYFIRNFTNEGDIVFDMWSGKGSVPFEALRNNRVGIGNDKSPEAYIMTHAKVRPVSLPSAYKYLTQIEQKMRTVKVAQKLSQLDRKASIFYSRKTFEQLLRLRSVLLNDMSDEAIFTKAVVFGLLHGKGSNVFSLSCSHSYSMSPAYVKNYARIHHLRRPTRNVIECIRKKAELLLTDPLPSNKGFALNNDSTQVNLPKNFVDMILTSPPYFDTQTYAWCNWLRLWFLGYDYRDVRKILAESGVESKYRDFMTKSIRELFRILKPGGNCFLVVGDVRINRGTKFVNSAEFLLPLCIESGFIVNKIIVDNIPSTRRVMTYIPRNKGIKIERIICMKKPK